MTGQTGAETTTADATADATVDETVVVLMADGQHDLVVEAIRTEMPGVDPALAILGAFARELARVTDARSDDEMGVKALGAMVGGLFGIATTSEDELHAELHAAGARLLGRLRQVESSLSAAAGALMVGEPQR